MQKQDLSLLALIGLTGFIFLRKIDIKSETIKLVKPLYGRITSAFGMRIHPLTGVRTFHNGVDIAGKVGDKIQCPVAGLVDNFYFNSSGGNQLIIKHDNGFITGYAHLNKSFVTKGNRVVQSQVIAEVGNTGNATGPHLHFTLKDAGGNYLDPSKYTV